MRFIIFLLVTIFISLPYSNLCSETIYSWTDKDGVRKYSNIAPEDDAENFEVMGEVPLSQAGVTVDDAEETSEGVEETSEGVEETAAEEPGDIVPEPEPENSTIDISEIEKQLQISVIEKQLEAQAQEQEQERSSQETAEDNMDAQFDAKVQAEKTRLQGEIDRIDQLAVGRGLSLPRKNTMLNNLRGKLDLLEKSPKEYFGAGDTN